MMKDISSAQFNERFLEKVSSVSGQAELQEAGRQYIKTELMESAFSRAIIPQEPITTADCQRNVADDSLYLIRDVEPDAEAVGVDNLGEPDGVIVAGTRYIIPIVNFKTKRFQITVESLRAYQYKVTKRIEDKSVPVIEALEDKFFLKLLGASLGAGGATGCKVVAGTSTDNLTIAAKDFPKLKNTLASGVNSSDPKRKEVGVILMSQDVYETAVLLPGAGDDFGKDRVYFGIASDTLYGSKILRTIKTRFLPAGHMFAFTTPDFLGHNFSLGDPTFEIRSQFGLIEWQTSESIGLGIGNRLSIALMALKGSVIPGTATSLEVTTDGTYPAAIANYYKSLKL
jgi:hypothetical protein